MTDVNVKEYVQDARPDAPVHSGPEAQLHRQDEFKIRDCNEKGSGEELTKQDFEKAAENAKNAVTGTAENVKTFFTGGEPNQGLSDDYQRTKHKALEKADQAEQGAESGGFPEATEAHRRATMEKVNQVRQQTLQACNQVQENVKSVPIDNDNKGFLGQIGDSMKPVLGRVNPFTVAEAKEGDGVVEPGTGHVYGAALQSEGLAGARGDKGVEAGTGHVAGAPGSGHTWSEKAAEKYHEADREAEREMTHARDSAEGLLQSGKDAAVRAKDAATDALKYIGGRMTAPVSGDEATDKANLGEAKGSAFRTVDQASHKVDEASHRAGEKAGEAKESTKSWLGSVVDSLKPHPRTAEERAEDEAARAQHDATVAAHQAGDKAQHALNTAREKASESAESAKQAARDATQSVKDTMQEWQAQVIPKNETEAALASGLIPSNTADLTRGAGSEPSSSGTAQGDKIIAQTEAGWGEENLSTGHIAKH
jgi:hypothetical protein